jgi:hypothetical protein
MTKQEKKKDDSRLIIPLCFSRRIVIKGGKWVAQVQDREGIRCDDERPTKCDRYAGLVGFLGEKKRQGE